MDPIKTFSITTDYNDRQSPLSWETRLFAEVVFLDKTHESSGSLLYQLKDNAMSLNELGKWKGNAASFPKESFVLLGEISEIDKKKKQIILSNQNVLSYRYLVIASGQTPVVTVYGDEFTAGIHALIDALRMKVKVPSSFATASVLSEKGPTTHSQEISVEAQDAHIDKIVHPSIHSATAQGHGLDINSITKRLYEVQI